MKTDFVPIKGYEHYYLISPAGEVYSTYYGIILKHGMAAGYPRVVLYKPGKKPKGLHIHRLLAQHFIPNPLGLPQVNHKDGNRENFELDNLEWCTVQENVQDGFNRGRIAPNKGQVAAHLMKKCEYCDKPYRAMRKAQKFCSNVCSAQWRVIHHPHTILRPRLHGQFAAIELFKSGVLK